MVIEFWILTPDGYDNRYETVDTKNVDKAFRTVLNNNIGAKNLKIYIEDEIL